MDRSHETRQELIQAQRNRAPEAAKLSLSRHFAALQRRMLVTFPD
ncbi:hypothetical protein AB0333_06315 [Citricoccus sp. NPDC079358]